MRDIHQAVLKVETRRLRETIDTHLICFVTEQEPAPVGFPALMRRLVIGCTLRLRRAIVLPSSLAGIFIPTIVLKYLVDDVEHVVVVGLGLVRHKGWFHHSWRHAFHRHHRRRHHRIIGHHPHIGMHSHHRHRRRHVAWRIVGIWRIRRHSASAAHWRVATSRSRIASSSWYALVIVAARGLELLDGIVEAVAFHNCLFVEQKGDFNSLVPEKIASLGELHLGAKSVSDIVVGEQDVGSSLRTVALSEVYVDYSSIALADCFHVVFIDNRRSDRWEAQEKDRQAVHLSIVLIVVSDNVGALFRV